jgi:hypothetical protein
MKGITFQATIEIQGINPYVLVTKGRVQQIKADWKRPLPVLVQVNGQPKEPWHINMMPRGDGTFYLYLHETVRKASHTKVGDTVTIAVAFDNAYSNGPQHPLPDWFKTPLEADPLAYKAWHLLPPSRQKEILRYFAGLRSDEAKTRNLAKVLHVLSGKPGRFMARDWKDGR